MKNLLFIIVLTCCFSGASQRISNTGGNGLFRYGDLVPRGSFYGTDKTINPAEIVSFNSPSSNKGSCYFYDTFLPGTVTNTMTKKTQRGFIVFDVYRGAMIMSLSETGNDPFLIKLDDDLVINFDNREFKILRYSLNGKSVTAYVEILDSLDNSHTLAVLHTKDKKFNQRVVSNVDFLLVDKKHVATRLRNDEKEIISNIDNIYKSQLDAYITNNNIRFEDDYKGLIAVARYYASVKNN